MKNLSFLLVLPLLLMLGACSEQHTQQMPESEVIAIVGDEVVTADLLAAFLLANGIQNASDEILDKGLKALINETAMANVANKKKLQLNALQLNNLKYLQLRALANEAKKDYLSSHEVTEEEIKQEYEKVKGQSGGSQYQIQHVLYKDEVLAIKMLETIGSVEDYKLVQMNYLIEYPNMKNVGNLGWVTLNQLPKGFHKAVKAATKNTVIKQVINSQFGAHIVYLEDIRDLKAPKFEDVKEGIINSLKAKRLSKFSQLAKAKAHVKIP